MGDALVSCSLLVLLSFAAVTASTPSASAAAPPTTAIFELQHRPLAVSAGRWGGAHPSNASAVEGERRGEAAAVQRRLTDQWQREQRRMRRRRLGSIGAAVEAPGGTAPLFEGIGTHYAHIYVGTPPQRVSVIVDTGSHHTAFPCDGCRNCGKHTDPYYKPKASSTNRELKCSECSGGAKCAGGHCQFSQSYTEGSSWKANQMEDRLWVGGTQAATEPAAQNEKLAIKFLFGCQYSETGLFRTQKADGIMGLSANAQTLVPQVKAAKFIESRTFALCFMKGGGIMSIGGAELSIQKEPMAFVPLSKPGGWFTVRLRDIRMGGTSDRAAVGSHVSFILPSMGGTYE